MPDVTPEAFEELFRATAPEVLRYLRRRVGVEADDLLGEVFVIAWQRRGDLPAPELHRAWLFGVARRLVLAQVRRQAAVRHATRDLARRDEASGAAEHAPSPDDRDAVVHRALAALPEQDRELLMLTVWEGLTVAEAAVSLDLRPGTARVRLHRARRRLADDPEVARLVEQVGAGC
ncbi:sigma-70 family RNA polymerase sigma factor [Nocardioides sp. KIGAM211]|uniref:Sigma-70 family RNA polymerase sigma factor n=1 Tax=Nocardioides luti TaxID=2761101 RepID=A0A7X0RCJ5_9ACTN|nr:sigma-70 family RNA polymerase sigma factor [Nocardioides luti]